MMLRAWYGRVEVFRQPDVEHESKPNGHVRVAGEVEVQLQRESQRGAPGVAEHDGGRAVEDRCHPRAEGVRNHHLLEQTDGEDEQPGGQIALGEDKGIRRRELRDELFETDDRAGDQMRKETDEEAVAEEVVLAGVSVIGVHQVSDLLECEEGNGEREHEGWQLPTGAERHADGVDQEVAVLEIAQQPQVHGNPERQQATRRLGRCAAFPRAPLQERPQREVEQDRKQNQRNELPVPPRIERQRSQGQKG